MFQTYNQDQNFLLPPDFKEFLWDSHEAVILSEIIDSFDHSSLLSSYATVAHVKGRPAYNPIMMLKVLFYSYMNQTFSSRKIAKKLSSDIAFMYLSWNNTPNFRSINRFRKEKWIFLEWLFVEIVLHAQSLWLISFWSVSLDGTKIYANASKNKCYNAEKLEKQMKSLFDQADEIDELEDEEFWEDNLDHIPQELRTKEGRDKKRKELEERQEKIQEKSKKLKEEIQRKKDSWIKQNRINFTDTDSRLMKMKRKDWWTWYNPQVLTENRFILSSRVPNTAEDTWELIPSLEKLKKQYNTLPKNQLADAGYASEENYEYLEKQRISSYIPHAKFQTDFEEYTYNSEENSYEDIQWNIYRFKQHVSKKQEWRTRGRPKKWERVSNIIATLYVRKTSTWKNKFLYVNKNWQRLCKENDTRLYTDEGRNMYKKRSWCVENVFGNIKGNLWFERFRLRGFQWVQIEWNLISLTHNLKKLISHSLA